MAHYRASRAVGEAVPEMMREACPVTDLQLGASPRFALASPADGFCLVFWRVGIGGMPRELPCRQTQMLGWVLSLVRGLVGERRFGLVRGGGR